MIVGKLKQRGFTKDQIEKNERSWMESVGSLAGLLSSLYPLDDKEFKEVLNLIYKDIGIVASHLLRLRKEYRERH